MSTRTRPDGREPVVVGVDDGPLRVAVLDRAAVEARRLAAAVLVVHGHDHTGMQPPGDDAGLRAEAYLRRAASDLEVRHVCVSDEAAVALLAAASPASLLVLGNRRDRLATEAGRTTEKVIGRAPCPVLVVGEHRVPEQSGSEGSHTTVAGVDDSPHGAAVLALAVQAARALTSPLKVIRVWEGIAYTEGGGLRRREIDPDVLCEAQDRLDALVAEAIGPDDEVSTTIVEDRPARVLIEAGRGAELLVLGHRGHSRPDRVGLGSTAHAVLAAAPCPVLVIGPGAVGVEPGGAVEAE